MSRGLYRRYCQWVLSRFPADLDRRQARERRNRGKETAARETVRALRFRFDQGSPPAPPHARRRVRRQLDRAERRWRGRLRVLERPDFQRAVASLGLDLRFDEVVRVAAVSGLVAAVLGSGLLAFAVATSSAPFIAWATAILVAGPVAGFLFVAGYPEAMARRQRVLTVGRAPEAVTFLAMALRLNPSLDRAIAFAAESADEPVATELRKVLWKVLLRSPAGLEEAFLRFANEWGGDNEDLKQALFALLASSLERSDASREATIEKARHLAFAGTQRRMRDYADSLRGPTTALFALGVLLPMMIGAMLPLLSLGGLGSVADRSAPPAGPSPWVAVLALDVAFPVALAAFAWHVLGRRPGTLAPPDLKSCGPRRLPAAIAVAIALAGSVPALLPIGPLRPLAPALSVATALGLFCSWDARGPKQERDRIKQLERELPDALFLLGGRIARGEPVERVLRSVSAEMEGSAAAAFFRRIDASLQLRRGSLSEALFAPEGPLAVPSRSVRGAMRVVVAASDKDPVGAGRAVVDLSSHMRELFELDREVRRELGGVVDAMRATVCVFGPLVLGVTAGMYALLARVFSGTISFALAPETFVAAVAVYLFLAVSVIVHFSTGIEHGPDPVQFRYSLGKSLPLSLATFAAAVVCTALAISA